MHHKYNMIISILPEIVHTNISVRIHVTTVDDFHLNPADQYLYHLFKNT